MGVDRPTQPPQHASASEVSAAAALGSADLLHLSYQAVALGGAGLQLLLSRRPLTLRRAVEALLLWELIIDLGHAVMNAGIKVQRDGLRWSLVSGIGGAGLLGVWANTVSQRRHKRRSRRGLGPLDLEVGGLGLSEDTLKALGQKAARMFAEVAGMGAEAFSVGSGFVGAPRDAAAARRAGREQRMVEGQPSPWQALTPAIQVGLLALYTLTRGGVREAGASPSGAPVPNQAPRMAAQSGQEAPNVRGSRRRP
jgi:hypothetical protein